MPVRGDERLNNRNHIVNPGVRGARHYAFECRNYVVNCHIDGGGMVVFLFGNIGRGPAKSLTKIVPGVHVVNTNTDVTFDQPGLAATLAALDDAGLDALDFGVIGFDREGRVQRYNAFESKAAGLRTERVLGQDLFTLVAPCMNNFLVAERFVEAQESGSALDDTISYVLTLRMRPTKVKLRLLSEPAATFSYVLVHRL